MTNEEQVEKICRALCKEYFWGELAGQNRFSASAQEQFNYQDANWTKFRQQASYLLYTITE